MEAERFENEEPAAFQAIDREVKHLLGGAWECWWLKTPLPGVVWCNCPHMAGLDGLKVADLTRAEVQGRNTIHKVIEFIRDKLPGFRNCYLIDLAPQTGIRQTRLLEGEYVMTKDDVAQRVRFEDSVARGRDYYYPYRTLVPRSVENLLVAGRHYSSTSAAQKMSREIPPCMAMGEAAGIAAALSLTPACRCATSTSPSCSARCAPRAPTPATRRARTPTSRPSPVRSRRPHDHHTQHLAAGTASA